MTRNGQFAGRTIFITGAAQGVGLATARRFAEEGATLALTDLMESVIDRAADLASEFGCQAIGMQADVRSIDQVRRSVAAASDRFGGIDVAVNVAGVFPKVQFEDMTEAAELQVMDVNVIGVTRVCRAVLPEMRGRRGASIVNIASGAAFQPLSGYTIYGASKAAVVALSRTLAFELAPDIRVNVVSPGATETEAVAAFFAKEGDDTAQFFIDRIPMGALARPEDVANGIVFLASERAAHITGATLPVNGGSLMR